MALAGMGMDILVPPRGVAMDCTAEPHRTQPGLDGTGIFPIIGTKLIVVLRTRAPGTIQIR